MARLTLPSGLELNRPLNFHSSTTLGSACLMRVRSQESVSPRQSSSSLILVSINSDGAQVSAELGEARPHNGAGWLPLHHERYDRDDHLPCLRRITERGNARE